MIQGTRPSSSDDVPVNIVERVMGHEQASTTLNRYTHTPNGYDERILAAFGAPADFSPTPEDQPDVDEVEEDESCSPSASTLRRRRDSNPREPPQFCVFGSGNMFNTAGPVSVQGAHRQQGEPGPGHYPVRAQQIKSRDAFDAFVVGDDPVG
jgi:hypothetical protein